MTKLTYYTPRSPLGRLLAPPVATAASYFPPRLLRPVVVPLRDISNNSRRPGARWHAIRAINLIDGDGMAIRTRRQHAGRS